MNTSPDPGWNLVESERGNLPLDEDAFEQKYAEWLERDWLTWLKANLQFPFLIERVEDDDDAYFTDIAKTQCFRLGHTMTATGLLSEDNPITGVLLTVSEGKKSGHVPLADVTVVSKQDPNYWIVREYVIWNANQ